MKSREKYGSIIAGFPDPSFQKGDIGMDFKFDVKKIAEYFNTLISFLTKLLVGLEVIESEEKAPYKDYLGYFETIISEVTDK